MLSRAGSARLPLHVDRHVGEVGPGHLSPPVTGCARRRPTRTVIEVVPMRSTLAEAQQSPTDTACLKMNWLDRHGDAPLGDARWQHCAGCVDLRHDPAAEDVRCRSRRPAWASRAAPAGGLRQAGGRGAASRPRAGRGLESGMIGAPAVFLAAFFHARRCLLPFTRRRQPDRPCPPMPGASAAAPKSEGALRAQPHLWQ